MALLEEVCHQKWPLRAVFFYVQFFFSVYHFHCHASLPWWPLIFLKAKINKRKSSPGMALYHSNRKETNLVSVHPPIWSFHCNTSHLCIQLEPGAGHGGSMHTTKVMLMTTIANKALVMKTWILNTHQAHPQASWSTSSACLSIFPFAHPLIYPSTCFSIYTCMYLYILLSIYTYGWMYLAIHQSTHRN